MRLESITLIIAFILLLQPVSLSHFLPNEKTINKNSDLQLDNNTIRQNNAEIFYYRFDRGHSIRSKKIIPIADALNLLNTLNSEKGSIDDIYQNLPYKELQINDKLFNKILFNSDNSNLFREITIFRNILNKEEVEISTSLSYNLLCSFKCKSIGLGFVLGSHSMIPTLGADLFGIFSGIGTVEMNNGFLDDIHLSGFHVWGYLGFIGNLLISIIPLFPGPIIFADGYTLASFAI